MAFLAPLIAPLIPGIAELGLIGQGIVGVGLSAGVSYLAKELQPKSTVSARSTQGMQLSLSYNPNEARKVPIGIAASAGALMYHNTYGPNGNDYVQMVYRLGDLPCDSLVGVWANGVKLTLGGNVSLPNVSGQTVAEYPGAMWIKFFRGAWDQAADSDLVSFATGTAYSSNNRGRGICYVRVTMKFDAKLFSTGLPAFVWEFKGGRFYDWRQDTTAGGSGSQRWGNEATYGFTENAKVIAYNWYRGITVNGKRLCGMNVPPDFLPLDNWTAAANADDEDVPLKNGGTQKRYRVGGIISSDADNTTVIRDLMTSTAASVFDCGGVFKVYSGVAQSPVMNITDEDFMALDAVTYVPKKSRASLVNSVFGSFNDPRQMYQSTALPPRISPDDIEADGGFTLPANYSLPYVGNEQQGQRALEIYRREGRFQRTSTGTLRPGCLALEAGDWVSWTSTRFGFENLLFRLSQASPGRDGRNAVELTETDTTIFAWNAGTDELDPLDPATVGEGGVRLQTPQDIHLLTYIYTGDGDQQTPALRITWTPIDDPSVTSIRLDYRKAGDTDFLTKVILDPTSGDYLWTEGVQGGLQYEARLTLITSPVRAVVASGWFETPDATPPQVVSGASDVEVPDGSITEPKLSEQVLYELLLSSAKASVQASVAAQIEELREWISAVAEASIGARLDGYATGARVTQEITQRADAVSALAQSVQTAITWINENAATVSEVIESLNGVSARWGVGIALTTGGQPYVTGLVQLDGSASGVTFAIGADKFVLYDPNVNGGDPVQIVTVAEDAANPGTYRMVLDGEMIANAIKAGMVEIESLKALSSNFGDMTCTGFQRSASGKMVLDWSNDRQWIDS